MVRAIVGGIVLVVAGVALVAFHRPVARWCRNRRLATRPHVPCPPLRTFTVLTLAVGILYAVVGVLALAAVGYWTY